MSSTPSSKSNSRGVRIGKYEVLSHIATGGMGAVYRALDTELNREVALKVLSPELAAKPNLVERFRREARSAAKLRHKNIVTIFECGESTGTHYLVMEFIDGVDLGDYLRAKGKLDVRLAWVLMRQATKALAHAHEQGIVHRDIKPSNFLLTKKDKKPLLKLTDMGLAREVNEEQFRVTTAGTTVGTVDYMSPEQARDSQSADTRSDLYSLGCAFFHLLTGQPPFEGSLTERILKHLETRPPDICQLNPAVPSRFKEILEKLLEKDPADRYQTPLELLRELNNPPPGLLDGGDAARTAIPNSEEGLANLEALAIDEAISLEVTPAPRSGGEIKDKSTEQIQLAKTPSSIKLKRPATDALVLPAGPSPAKKTRSDTKVETSKPVPPPKPRPDEAAPVTPAKPKRPLPRPRRERQVSTWRSMAGIGAGLAVAVFLVIALIRLAAFLSSGASSGTNPQNQTNNLFPTPGSVVPGSGKNSQGNNTNAKPPEVVLPPVLFTPSFTRTAQELREEFEGPHLTAAAPPQAAKTFIVSRTPKDTMSFATLREALEKIAGEEFTVIEIHVNGPLKELSIPELRNRNILIRAGQGYRPLVVWDVDATEKNASIELPYPKHFVALTEGSLRLEDLHFAVKWAGTLPVGRSSFFHLKNSSLVLSGCSVSVAGKHPIGFSICRLQSDVRVTALLDRCFFRGSECTALAVEGSEADVLVRDSLLVNGTSEPLLRGKAEYYPPILRLVRSTLVSGNHLLQIQPAQPGVEGNFRCLCCDSLLAHSKDAAAASLLVVNGATLAPRNWKAYNCLYTGWNQLLDSSTTKLDGKSLKEWRGLWKYDEGDQALPGAWPSALPANLAEVPAAVFQSEKTPAYFGALSAPGVLGCDLKNLPNVVDQWLQIAY